MAASNTLAHKERQLDLLMALDRARDAADIHGSPTAMFHAIMDILASYFQADACAIMILAEEDTEIEAITYTGTDEKTAIQLCKLAVKNIAPAPIKTSEWQRTLGVHIVQEERNKVLGGLFLARKTTPFDDSDITLLTMAESQIDSAIVQARTILDLAERNRQLEAIFQIDRIRDTQPSEEALIGSFTAILIEYFQAELCTVFLSHIDSGEMLLRGIVDKDNIPVETLDTIRELTSNITIPQRIETPEAIGKQNLLAAPLIVAGVKLGSVVIGRQSAFTLGDHRLLYAMMSQMDSAIVHSRVIQQLSQRNAELETIYRIDQIRDSDLEFEMMMQQVLGELCNVVRSEMGYLMLYEDDGKELEMKATTVEGILTSPIYREAIIKTSQEALFKGEPVYSNRPTGIVRSIVAIPLILNDRVMGVFGTVNSMNPRGFSAEDRRLLTAITSQVDTAIFERLERRQMRRVLSRSVDPKVLDHLLQYASENILAGDRVHLTALFADLRGSTEWTQRTTPEELVSTLNKFLTQMTDIIFKYGGTLDKFVGDEIIALFGSPIPMKDHAKIACQCALEMQIAHQHLQEELAKDHVELPPMGVGVSSGEVIAGEFGPPLRTDFTAMGPAMNLGARLCGAAKAKQVYISQNTLDIISVKAEVRQLEPMELKGIGTVPIYELIQLKDA